MAMIFVKPSRKGLIVRHPEKIRHVLSEEGEWVKKSSQWLRYIQQGAVVEAKPPVEKPAKVTKPKVVDKEDDKSLIGGE